MKNYDKKSISNVIYNELIKKDYGKIYTRDIEYYQRVWWITPYSSNTLRLSESGRQAFELAEIEKYSFPFRFNLQTKKFNQLSFLRFLSKTLKCPYYVIEFMKVEVFDSKTALAISLYGDILTYYKKHLEILKKINS